jgi:hypothetical protein
MSTICMKLDPSMHIGMHLVCFSKTGCDNTLRRVRGVVLFALICSRGYKWMREGARSQVSVVF